MNWTNWAWIVGGLLGSLVIGMIIGRIVAGIKYPDPDKPHIFTPKQTAIVSVGVLVAAALIVFAMLYQPKPSQPDGDSAGMEDLLPNPDGDMLEGDGVGTDEPGIAPMEDTADGTAEELEGETENTENAESSDGAESTDSTESAESTDGTAEDADTDASTAAQNMIA